MSDEAKALARKIMTRSVTANIFNKGGSVQNVEFLCDEITRALHAERVKVWEAAAKVVEEYVSGGGTTSPTQGTLRKIATRLRAKAQEDIP